MSVKKIILALLIIFSLSLSLGQEKALAQTSCLQKYYSGAATTLEQFYEKPYAVYAWDSGVIKKSFSYNNCGTAVAIKINVDDWLKLKKEGKLDGIRYIQKNNKTIYINKVVGTESRSINPEDFFVK